MATAAGRPCRGRSLPSELGPEARAGLKVFTSLGGAVVGFILAWKGIMVTLDYFRRGVTVIGILNTPQFLLMAIIPIGGTAAAAGIYTADLAFI